MLRIEHLTKTYPGGKVAVRDLCLHVEPGDIYGFIGHNGAGKTTTIKAAVGLLDFESGRILIDGHSIQQEPMECKRSFSYLPDDPVLFPYLTGMQYLRFVADVFAVPAELRRERIEKETSVLGLRDALGALISTYSHGMKQKLAIAAALLHNPKLLILDEPFVGLDPEAVAQLKQTMRRLCEAGAAVFFSTHVLDTAEKICNKVAILRRGQLVAAGQTELLTGRRSLEEIFLEVVRDGNAAGNPDSAEG